MQLAARTSVALLLVSFVLSLDASATKAATSCQGARAVPTHTNLGQINHATLCLINTQRRAQGLPAVRMNSLLRLAALRHSREMVTQHYFAHDSRDGSSFLARIRRTGYLLHSRSWMAGENLAWGVGRRSTPASTVRAWMNSPPHRHNILTRGYRDIGIGVVPGGPRARARGTTYTTDFGYRTRR
jgi:uncharacterized protein YkwD